LVGWETLSDAIATDTDQFGGAYLNRITQLLIGADIAAFDVTLAPIIGTKWTFKSGKLWLQDVAGTHTINIIPDTQTVDTVIKTPAQSFTPDYVVLRTQAEELQNKTIDGTKNTITNITTIPADNTITDAKIAAQTSTKITISNKAHLPADAVYTLDTQTVRNKTMDYNLNTFINFPFGSGGGGGADPTLANTWSGVQTFRDQDILLRNPANTFSLKYRNPVILADYDFQFNTPYAYYIFIDVDDGNKYKCRDNRTGAIVRTHATNADDVLQYAIDQLSTGSNPSSDLWSGGKYGAIWVGPGVYNLYQYVILRSHITIDCAGSWATTFTMPDNLYNGGHNNNTIGIFKSSTWDVNSIVAGGSVSGDNGVRLRNCRIYGNWKNNLIPDVNTATTTVTSVGPPLVETAGTDSWGHGIAYFGNNLVLDNVIVHGCPGAGIIVQSGNSTAITVSGGYPYPTNAGTGTGAYDTVHYITNCRSFANGRQGFLIRAPVYVSNFWAFFNGEAGIDIQRSANFYGSGWIEGIEIFMDGFRHGLTAYGGNQTTYDPLGFEMRVGGSTWLSDSWIEAPNCVGDNLMIGANDGRSAGSTGYNIWGNGALTASNLVFDYPRSSAIMLGANAGTTRIREAYVIAIAGAGAINNVTPLSVLGNNADIELTWTGFVDTGSMTTNGVVIGTQTPPSPTVGFAWGNRLVLNSINNTYVIDNQNATNHNAIIATMINLTGGATKSFVKPGGIALDTTASTYDVNIVGGSGLANHTHNGGIATFSGDGSNKIFNIPHLLIITPGVANANANADDARGSFKVTYDATNVIITFGIAPPNGSSNVKFSWSARVTP